MGRSTPPAADPCTLLCCAALPQTTPWALTDAFVSYFLEQKANLQVHTSHSAAQRTCLHAARGS